MAGETDDERETAMAGNATGDQARTHGSADETERIMTGEDETGQVPPAVVRPDRDPSEPRGWPGEDSAGQRADG